METCITSLTIVNNAAINLGVPVSFQVSVFSSFGLSTQEWLFSIEAAPIYILIYSAWGFPFLYILTNTCCLMAFLMILTGER